MTYLPPAARQLILEVEGLRSRVSAKPVGDPDGLGVTRQVEFDVNTSKWLVPLLEVANDERVAGVDSSEKRAVVTFVGSHLADFAHEFNLGAVDAVLNEAPIPSNEEGGGAG